MNHSTILGKALKAKGLTQEKFARAVGTTQGSLSKWISDSQAPNIRQWDKVVAFLKSDSRTRDLVAVTDDSVMRINIIEFASAGRLAEPMSQVPAEDYKTLTTENLGSGEFFALTVIGDSMNRVSPEGSIIVVARDDRVLISGKYYVFSVRGQTTYKRWVGGDPSYLEPFSTNESHKPIFLAAEVVGRVRRTILNL